MANIRAVTISASAPIIKTFNDIRKGVDDVARALEKELQPAVDRLDKSLSDSSKNSKLFGQELDAAGRATETVTRKTEELFKSMMRVASGFRQTGQAVFAFAAVLSILAVPRVRRELEDMGKFFSEFQDNLVRTAKTADLFITAEEEMAAGGDGLSQNIEVLGDRLLEMGRMFAVPTEQLAAMSAVAGQAGAQTVKEIEEITAASAIFSTITDITGERATEAATRILAAYGKLNEEGVAELDNLINTINLLENTTVAAADDIVTVLLDAAGEASKLGVAEQDLIGFSAFLVQTGLSADEAGTALRNMFRQITQKSDDVATLLDISREDLFAKLDQPGGAIDVVLMLADALTKVESDSEAAALAAEVFDIRASKAIDRVRNDTEGFVGVLERSREEWVSGNSAIVEYEKSLRSFKNQWQILQNNIKALAGTFLKDLQPAIEQAMTFAIGAVQAITDVVGGLSTRTKLLSLIFAGLFVVLTPLVTIMGSLVFAFGLFLNGITNLIAGLGLLGSQFGAFIAIGGLLLVIFRDRIPDAINFLADMLGELAMIFADLAQDAVDWGTNIIAALADGMVRAISTYIIPAINAVISVISAFLEGKSPPKKGPLSKIIEWGRNTFSAYLRGFTLADFDVLDKIGRMIQTSIRNMISLEEIGELEGMKLVAHLRSEIARGLAEFRRTGTFPSEIFGKLEDTLGEVGREMSKLIKLQIEYNKLQKELDELQRKRRNVTSLFRREARAIQNNTSLTAAQKAAALASLRARRDAELDEIDRQEQAKQEEAERYERLISFQEKFIDALQDQEGVFADIARAIDRLEKSLSKSRKEREKQDKLEALLEELAILHELQKQYEAMGLDVLPLLREEVRLRKRISEEMISRGMDPSGQISAIKLLEQRIEELKEEAKKAGEEDGLPRLGSAIEGLGGPAEETAESIGTVTDAVNELRDAGSKFFGQVAAMKRAVALFIDAIKGELEPGELAFEIIKLESIGELGERIVHLGLRIRRIIEIFLDLKNSAKDTFRSVKGFATDALTPFKAFTKGLRGEEFEGILPVEKMKRFEQGRKLLDLYTKGLGIAKSEANELLDSELSLNDTYKKLRNKLSEYKDEILKSSAALLVLLDAFFVLKAGGLSLIGILSGLTLRHGNLGKAFSFLAGRSRAFRLNVAKLHLWWIQLTKAFKKTPLNILKAIPKMGLRIVDSFLGLLFVGEVFTGFNKKLGRFFNTLTGKIIPTNLGKQIIKGMGLRQLAGVFSRTFSSNIIGAAAAVLFSLSRFFPGRLSSVIQNAILTGTSTGLRASLGGFISAFTGFFSRGIGGSLGNIRSIIMGILPARLTAAIGVGLRSIATSRLAGIFVSVIRTVLSIPLLSVLAPFIAKLGSLFTLIIGSMGGLVTSALAFGGALAGGLLLIIAISGTLVGMFTFLAQNIGLVIQRGREFIENFLRAMGLGVETAEGFKLSFEGISETIGRIKDGLMPIIGLFIALGRIIMAFVVGALPGLGTIFGATIKIVLEALALLLNMIGGAIEIIGVLAQAFATGDFSKVVPTIEKVAKNIVDSVVAIWGGVFDIILGTFDAVARGVFGAIVELLSLVGVDPEVVKDILEFGDALIDGALSIGRSFVEGLLRGMKSFAGRIGRFLKRLVLGIINFIKRLLGISSPSRETEKIGVSIIEGLIEGIKDMAGALFDAFISLLERLMNRILAFGFAHAPNLTIAIIQFIWDAVAWLRNTGIPMFRNIIASIVPALIAIFSFLKTTVLPIIIDVFRWLGTTGFELAKRVFTWLRDVGLPVLGKIAIKAIEAFDRGFGFLQENVFPIIKRVFNWLTEKAIPKIREVADSIMTFIGEAINWLRENWDEIKTRILGVWDTVSSKVKGVLDEWMPKFQALWSRIKEIIGLILGIYFQGFMLIISLVKEAIQGFIDKMSELWQSTEDVRKKIREILSTGINYIKEKVLGFFGDWIDDNEAISEGASTIKDAIRDLWDKGVSYIKEGFEDFFEDLIGWLDDVIEGLEDVLGLLEDANKARSGGGGGGTGGFGGEAEGAARGGILFHRTGQSQGALLRVAEKENEFIIPQSELESFFSNYTVAGIEGTGNNNGVRDLHLHMHNPVIRDDRDIRKLVREAKREFALQLNRG